MVENSIYQDTLNVHGQKELKDKIILAQKNFEIQAQFFFH